MSTVFQRSVMRFQVVRKFQVLSAYIKSWTGKEMVYSLGAICGREPSLNTRDIRTPTPSKTPNRMPHATAEPKADRGPPINGGSSKAGFKRICLHYALRSARHPPVIKPEIMAFHASSFCRQPLMAQSNVENMPPHTPKLPPVTGARAFIDEMAPTNRSP